MDKEESVKTKEEKSAEELEASKEIANQQLDGTLEKLMLNTTFNKYDIIVLARRWAYELKAKEGETRTLQELIAVAIQDILSSRVSHKMVWDLPHLIPGRKQKTISAAVLESLSKKVDEPTEKKGKKS